jgi:segregation and condensation protein B
MLPPTYSKLSNLVKFTKTSRSQNFSSGLSQQAVGSSRRFWLFHSTPSSDQDRERDASTLFEKNSSSDLEEARKFRQRVEAILLTLREPVSSRRLAQLADLADATQARTLVRSLNETYDREGHAFRVEEVAGGWMMLTRPAFAKWLRKVEGLRDEEYPSQTALETLAIIAYRQPIPRAEVEAIRGVGCDEPLRQLMERDLVRICGRSEDLGRPYLYGTTKRFLQLFGLKSLDRLPRASWIRQVEEEFSSKENPSIQPSVLDSSNS